MINWSSNILTTSCKELKKTLIGKTPLEKTLILGKIEGRRRGQQRVRWLDGITDLMDMRLNKLWKMVKDWQGSLACCNPWGHKESNTTWRLNNSKWHIPEKDWNEAKQECYSLALISSEYVVWQKLEAGCLLQYSNDHSFIVFEPKFLCLVHREAKQTERSEFRQRKVYCRAGQGGLGQFMLKGLELPTGFQGSNF